MLSAHYRSPINFSADLMEASKNGLDRIITAVENLEHLAGASNVEQITEEEKANLRSAAEYTAKFEAAMDDDFNTADAVSAIFELVKYANTNASADNSKEYLNSLHKQIKLLSDILGIIVEKETEILAEDIEKLIEARQAARKEKNFARADEIRDELLAKGIVLEDTREGVKWKKA
jgi:cysteinyl-tRNA synthetase